MAVGIEISADGSHLVRGGRFFPYIVDTAWSAFALAEEREWAHYVATRRQQGFTGVAISVLPILHDRSLAAGESPFAVGADGAFDFDKPEPRYFAKARRFVDMALEQGLVPTLVLLWCNYVPGSWGALRTPDAVMTPEQRASYVALAADTFGTSGAIFAISGDDDFASPAASAAYLDAIGQLREQAPGCLVTAHSSPFADLPDELASALDFYVYQSGHDPNALERTWELPRQYLDREERKPVVNLEPPYEQHGHGDTGGRFTRTEVRNALWWSILGGASAGIGYGAHGVWQWFREGDEFNGVRFSNLPFPWQVALRFEGAKDIGLIRDLLERHSLHRLDAAQHLIDPETVEQPAAVTPFVRAAASGDRRLVAVYLPYATGLTIDADLSRHAMTAWDLDGRARVVPRVLFTGGRTLITQADVLADMLVVFENQ